MARSAGPKLCRFRRAVRAQVLVVWRKGLHAFHHVIAEQRETPRKLRVGWNVGERMPALRPQALAVEDREPARFLEQVGGLDVDVAVGLVHLAAASQGIRPLDGAAVTPERRIVALGGRVVQHQDVAYLFELVARQRVESLDGRRIEAVAREQEQQPRDRRLYEMNTGGLQRLEESAGEPDGHDILLPDFL